MVYSNLSNQIGRIMNGAFDAEAFKFADLIFSILMCQSHPREKSDVGIQPESNFRLGLPRQFC